MMDRSKQFAISVVKLALTRNGYYAYEDAPIGAGLLADVFAAKKSGAEAEERIVVEVKTLRNHTAIPAKLESQRLQLRAKFQYEVYFAFFVESEGLLIVDAELCKRMRFREDEIRLEVLPVKVADLTSG
ncbi:hypothetical protein GTP46_10740 [Duganella sp. FT135W]|uniref:Protein NO VEIN C-terminal domain-containing protein n=1 Tax=Duganella flavida TaxID=2692175 RepID=A0A6L8KF73_9BURK|nr:hypothetical protein [Duganella flavida]MYM23121.1 hypothetical protein [Duganella flavida]